LILPSQYYEKNLYPLQDGVLNILSRIDTNFFLTGGTALSRAYFNHRYSDDLDLFINNSDTYDEQLNKVLTLLKNNGYFWHTDKDFTRAKDFTTIKVSKDSQTFLKLDFVNDKVPIFGKIQITDLFIRTDSLYNILTNKLSAIFRFAAKDIADIREIFLHETIDWSNTINDARQKEAGLELTYISEIISSMPESEFNTILWVKDTSWEEFKKDIDRIAFEMLNG